MAKGWRQTEDEVQITMQIMIEVRGGNVVSVRSYRKGVRVTPVDWNNENIPDATYEANLGKAPHELLGPA